MTSFILRPPLHVLEKDSAAAVVLDLLEMFGALAFSQQLIASHTFAAGMEAQREGGVGSPQMQVDQVGDSSFDLGGIILVDLGAHG